SVGVVPPSFVSRCVHVTVASGSNAPGPRGPVLKSIDGTSVGAHTCARCIAARLSSGVAYESFRAAPRCAQAAKELLSTMRAAAAKKRGIRRKATQELLHLSCIPSVGDITRGGGRRSREPPPDRLASAGTSSLRSPA